MQDKTSVPNSVPQSDTVPNTKVARITKETYTVRETATGQIIPTVPADLIEAGKEKARTFRAELHQALARRPKIIGIPSIDTKFEPVYLPVPPGTTFTDGEPILSGVCLAMSTDWFTKWCKQSKPGTFTGKETEPVAIRPNDPETGDPCPWIMVILPEDPTAAESAFLALLRSAQSETGTYLESGLGGFTPPCTVWTVTPDAKTVGGTDHANS